MAPEAEKETQEGSLTWGRLPTHQQMLKLEPCWICIQHASLKPFTHQCWGLHPCRREQGTEEFHVACASIAVSLFASKCDFSYTIYSNPTYKTEQRKATQNAAGGRRPEFPITLHLLPPPSSWDTLSSRASENRFRIPAWTHQVPGAAGEL